MNLEDKIRADIENRVREGIDESVRRRGGLPAGTLPGLLLILIGSIFLLDHLGFIHIHRLWAFWPMVLVFIGLVKLVQPRNRSAGLFWVVAGLLVQLNQLGYLHLSWETLWPLALILAGLFLLSARLERFRPPQPPGGPSGSNEVLNENVLFGGVERRVHVNNFRGGNISATFGGVEIDFRSADIDGNEAVVYIEAIFGGIELVVPERWAVVYQGQSIFGGYSDETRPPVPDPVGGVLGGTPTKKLILRGRVIFGGITVKN